MATRYPPTIAKLVSLFMRFEGVGRKTAERLSFNMLSHWHESALSEFIGALSTLKSSLHPCPICHCLIEEKNCPFCQGDRLKEKILCIVAQPRDVYLIESTDAFHGAYFVLGTLLSPLDGRGLRPEIMENLFHLIEKNQMREVLLAFDSSIEGDATASYVRTQLADKTILVTKLASGIPMGTPLDFVDRGTLFEALRCRQHVSE